MRTINVPTKEHLSEDSQQLFEAISKKTGKVPNLYATIGYSANALKGILAFEEAFSHSTFTAKEREGISLVVSQVNECNYCLSAHTMLPGLKGYNSEEIIGMRKGSLLTVSFKPLYNLRKP